jgi:hypothetical protein
MCTKGRPRRSIGVVRNSASRKGSPSRLHGFSNYLIRAVIIATRAEIAEHISDLCHVPGQIPADPRSRRDTPEVVAVKGLIKSYEALGRLIFRFPPDYRGNQPVQAFVGRLTGPKQDIHYLLSIRAAEPRCDLLSDGPVVNSAGFDEIEDRYGYIPRKGQLRPPWLDEIARFIFCASKHDRHIIGPARKACRVHQLVRYGNPHQIGGCMHLTPLTA